MGLKGAPEFRARMKAIKLAFKPIGKKWGEDTVDRMRPRINRRTGRVQDNLRVREASQRRAVVSTHYTATFPDKGSKPHQITAKKPNLIFEGRGGRTIFAKKVNHPGNRAQRFARTSALESLQRQPMSDELIRLWNEAA